MTMHLHCVDCGKRKGNTASMRCYSCAAKERVSRPGAIKAMSDARKALWNNPEYASKLCDMRSQLWYRSKQSATHRSNWAKGVYDSSASLKRISPLETIVAETLDMLGINYIKQFRPPGYSKVYDFLLSCEHVLIEVDSNYWHHSDMMLRHGKAEKDAEKELWALDHGFYFARIDEQSVRSDQLVDLLQQALQEM